MMQLLRIRDAAADLLRELDLKTEHLVERQREVTFLSTKGLGARVQGLGSRVSSLGSRVQGPGSRVSSLESRV
eukprot:2629913-Rhodomonas_salina.3